ncbi:MULTISPECIES: flagellar protein FlaG [unclassified Shewanella]|uniref:flagellar protein FlaG n=1 Tax=unclassified Shewanella TaxID=196818 RepID=UPI001BBD162D|nr:MULTISPECIES: flagellar protein FlaG [unclassified Shewanella]GIU09873.1 flagella locus protein FlaG [Shewanella sp. MBTL60-112-B1]GIU37411.1 flagella locus protein FlaG [Shewanella sp. MBTL60-112-B2]
MDVNVTNNSVAPIAIDLAVKTQNSSQDHLAEINASSSLVSQTDEVKAVNNSSQAEDSLQGESVEQMESVVNELSDMMSMLRKGLAFKLDESLGQQVVSVVDIDTGDLIRQIPNEEALELAIKLHEKIAEMDGLLMSTQV